MKTIDILAAVLLVIGGLNWGLVGMADLDLVAALFGATSPFATGVYALVGLAAVWQALQWRAIQRRWLPATATLALALLIVPVSVAAQSGSEYARAEAPQADDIVTTAVKAGSFTTLATALETAGLVETLQGEGPFTVFAPTDEAFAKLPEGTVEALLADREQLVAVLTYHVVPGRLPASEVVGRSTLETVNGESIRIRVSGGKVSVDNATVLQADVGASNGVIHVIDHVILPSPATGR